jgi:fucose permease
VLLGCILPRLSATGHLRDQGAGLFLLVQFAAAASGALLVRGSYWKALACGYALTSLSALSIVLLHSRVSLAAFGFYGLGLGVAMTSTSMLIGRLYPDRKGAALALLNFSWSVGSVICPLLVARYLPLAGSTIAFAPVALFAAPFALLPLLATERDFHAIKAMDAPLTKIDERKAIFYFALLSFLYVGIEATVGNWMTTYVTRTISWNFSLSSLAVSCFWGALLLGRATTPGILRIISEHRLYRVAVLAMIVGVCMILAAHGPGLLVAGSVFTGFALAPVFPLTLSLFMERVGESRNVGWVFATAGLGGAVLSWLTGAISTESGSLRVGLTVPVVAALVMAAMIFGNRMDRSSRTAV